MLRRSWIGICSVSAVISFIFAGILQIFDCPHIACWFIVLSALDCVIVIFPESLRRINFKNKGIHNYLILQSTVVITALLVFVMVSLSYFGLFHKELLSFFELVFYPCAILYALTELGIDYYKRQNSKIIEIDVYQK